MSKFNTTACTEHVLFVVVALFYMSFADETPGLREDIALENMIKKMEMDFDEWKRRNVQQKEHQQSIGMNSPENQVRPFTVPTKDEKQYDIEEQKQN